jgi:hypothetical protein
VANQKISTLPPAATITGSELAELVQGGVNVKASVISLIQTPQYSSQAPGAGTIAVLTLNGPFDCIVDIDTTAGNITIDTIGAQRDGQCVVISNIGANLLEFVASKTPSALGIRANAGPITALQGDGYKFQYSASLGFWLVI